MALAFFFPYLPAPLNRTPGLTLQTGDAPEWGMFSPSIFRSHGWLKRVFTLSLLSVACVSSIQSQSPCNDGWRTLFNGQDLDGWSQIGSAKWRVEDGVVAGGQDGDPKRSGLLTTTEQFQDFELKLEFMIDEHGKYNSGVYLRNEPGKASKTGYQINIGRGAAEEYCGGLFTDRWLDKGDEKDSIRKKLDWNELHITAKGSHIEVLLNGIRIVDYTDPNPPEKFLQKGVIGIQTYGAEGHAGWVKFRRICIREFPKAENKTQ